MKILMIAPQPFFEPRGTPISVYQRLHALAALGHQVDLLTFHVGQDVSIRGVKIHRVPSVPFIRAVKVGPSWAKLLLDILLFFQAIFLLSKKRYDVIHSHEEAAFFSVILSALFRTRHLYDMHSSLPRQLKNFGFGYNWLVVRLFEMLESWVLNTCDAVITIGSGLEAHVKDINPELSQIKIDNLPLHVNGSVAIEGGGQLLRKKWGLDDNLSIVYTGTFEPYQGLGLLLESAKIVKEHYPKVTFILVGGKPKQIAYWRRKSRELGIEDRIIFVGNVSPPEAIAYLDMASILVSPRVDGTAIPLKIYSYLYAGKPIVATNLAAHTQILNKRNALLVGAEGDAFANGILTLLQSPGLRQSLGDQAHQFAKENFGPANYLAKLSWIYGKLDNKGEVVQQETSTVDSPNLNPES